MANAHTPADNIFYDLIAIQYHALKGAQAYDQYLNDVEEHDDVREFLNRIKEEDSRRAKDAHRLLGELTGQRHGAMK
jgi:hypothetical protein